MGTIPYADTAYGYAYFQDRLRTEPWDRVSLDTRVKALKMATNAIDNLNFAGVKNDPAQPNQFPRGTDTVVPENIKKACCELALAFLDDVDPNIEIENLNITGQSLGDVRTTYERSFAQPHILAGISSVQAWHFLLPYLRDPNEIRMIKDSYKLGPPQSFI